MRKLASIQKVQEVKNIEGADRIQAYRINGWWVVDKKDAYQVGDLVTYVEIDSFIPHELAPFLTKEGQEPKEYNGVKGQRLRTVKLKGQLSQGLLLPVHPMAWMVASSDDNGMEGFDCTNLHGIQKWEAPVPVALAGTTKGNFPSAFAKSDQERVQNLDIEQYRGFAFHITEKLDGSSMSVYYADDVTGVCSRNLDLKEDDSNTFWSTAKKQNLLEIAERLSKQFGRGVMLQGELIGPGIQGNPYNLTEHKFFLYNIQKEGAYFLSPELVQDIANKEGILHVPVLQERLVLDMNREELLKYAEGKSVLNHKAEREGIVLKAFSRGGADSIQFKAISNRWLLKGGE